MLLGGDSRQTACVIRRGSNTAIIENGIKQSPLWRFVRILHLTTNMRANGDVQFSQWLLSIGDGQVTNDDGFDPDVIEVPEHMVTDDDIVTAIYGRSLVIRNISDYVEEMSKKVVLTPKNKEALALNNKILDLLPTNTTEYKSADSIISGEEDLMNYPVEFLNQITPSGVPPHSLHLKVGSIVMLIRNLNGKRVTKWDQIGDNCTSTELHHCTDNHWEQKRSHNSNTKDRSKSK